MKHTMPVTVILVVVFVASQLLGLALINKNATITYDEQGVCQVTHEDTALGPRPTTTGFDSLIYLLVGLVVGTVVLLILVRFRLFGVWKLWFFVAVWLASIVSLGVLMNMWVAVVLAFILAAWKIFKPNIIVHNATEVLVYSGIALLVVPLFDKIIWAFVLLALISAYDAYAVWRSKHMIKMAQFQTESKLFAGLFIPYEPTVTMHASTPKTKSAPAGERKNAILGGGDIAFPLLFIGIIMDNLITQHCLSKLAAFGFSLIIVLFAALALLWLFVKAKKDQFYPAMPFLTAGCFVGYAVMWLVMQLL